MTLSDFEITRRWPATRPDVIQLYSLPTPNGIKASAMLEESGLDYEAHRVNFREGDQLTPEYLSLNPNNKIPAMIDPDGPGGAPIGLWESGAILIYLADKSGRLLAADGAARYETLKWLMFQIGGPGPMFGQLGFFHRLGGRDFEDKRPLERYRDEALRLLGVLDGRLAGRGYVATDDYSIADLALWPWVAVLDGFYDAAELLNLGQFEHVAAWLERCEGRPASQAAKNIPPAPG